MGPETGTSHFCTFFDRNYLARGLALYDSLSEHHPSFHVWMLCMDDESLDGLGKLGLGHCTPIPLGEIERHDGRLLSAKESRNKAEYYFTVKSFFMRRLLDSMPEGGLLTYLDADMFAFSRLDTADPSFRERSILLSPHRISPSGPADGRFGIYNAGMVSARRDPRGKAFLDWWSERCLEWCYDRPDGERYADQKYLDRVPGLFEGVGFFRRKGINLAPWNLGGVVVGLRGDTLVADEDPLVLFHFHGLRALGGGRFDSNARNFRFRMTSVLREKIYKPYVIMLMREESRISDPNLSVLHVERQGIGEWDLSGRMPKLFGDAIRGILDLYYGSTFLVSREDEGFRDHR